MAFNQQLANRIREQLKMFPELFTDKRMFGGVTFLYQGKMTIGIVKEDLAVRIVAEKMETELAKDNVRPMDFEAIFTSVKKTKECTASVLKDKRGAYK